MINIDEAYRIAKRENPLSEVENCLDFGAFYLFNFVPLYIKDKSDYFSGVTYPAVNKKTGKLFEYDVTSDLDAYDKATQVELKTFMKTKLSELI